MNKSGKMIVSLGTAVMVASCGNPGQKADGDFKYLIDEFADLKIMRYQIPGWDNLTLRQKEYVYHLGEAAKYGRDIIWVQNCKVNLPVRKAVETILEKYGGDRNARNSRTSPSMPRGFSSATAYITTMPRTSSSLNVRRNTSGP